jgi:tRNA A37 threonylcarbamoyladenosine synthetase subunit TsaC/SUA5/YrdC
MIGVDTVINIFSNLEASSYKAYLSQIKTNTQDLGLILALKQFNQCRKYYQKEREIAEDMLDEYRSYIFGGHV